MNIQAMREKRGQLTASLRALLDKTPADKWSDKDQRQYDNTMAEVEKLDAQIDRAQRALDAEAESMFRNGGRNTEAAATGWTDANGRPVQVLGPNDRLVDTVRRNFDTEDDERPAGDALAQLVQAVANGGDAAAVRALTTGSDTEGGIWLNPSVGAEIIDLARGMSVAVNAGMRTLSMESPEVRLVRVEEDATPNWIGEQSKVKRAEPSFGALRLVAKKLIVHVPVSSELIEDASNLSNELSRLLAEAFAAEIDRIALNGAGKSGEPIGILNTSTVQSQTPAAYDYEALLDALQALEDENFGAGSMVHEPSLARTLRGQKDSNGQYLAPPADLVEVPRFVSTRLPTNRAIVGNFNETILGVRSQLAISVNESAGLERDEVIVVARWRGDFGIARPRGLVNLNVGG